MLARARTRALGRRITEARRVLSSGAPEANHVAAPLKAGGAACAWALGGSPKSTPVASPASGKAPGGLAQG